MKIVGNRFIEWEPAETFLHSGRDATLIVESCISAKAMAALLYPANLPVKFFDLSSGEAGEILQKLRNYRIRLAVVCAPRDNVQFSSRFVEMVAEESRTGFFRIFESAEAARPWLSQTGG